MGKISVENLTVEEIKELIDNEIITLEKLDNTALEKIMNYEIDMLCLGGGNMITICRCSEILNARNDLETLNKDRIFSIINEAKKEHVIIIDDENHKNPKAKAIKKHNIVLRRIGLVAAIITLMLATTTIVAAAFGVNIFEYISEVVRQEDGTKINVDGFTFYHNGESKQYSSIEDMIAQEKLDIMYPTKWPEGIDIDNIQMTQLANGKNAIQIFTNNTAVNIIIELSSEQLESDNANIYTYNGISFYIKKEDRFISYCNYNGNTYYLSATTKEDLILIIENMEE